MSERRSHSHSHALEAQKLEAGKKSLLAQLAEVRKRISSDSEGVVDTIFGLGAPISVAADRRVFVPVFSAVPHEEHHGLQPETSPFVGTALHAWVHSGSIREKKPRRSL